MRTLLIAGAALLAMASPAAAAGPDLSIAASHSGPFVAGDTAAAGDKLTLTVTNAGDAPSSGTVTVVDRIHNGAGLNYANTTGTDPSWTCSQANSVVTCTRSDALAPGASYPPITIGVTVNSTAAQTISNTPTVTLGAQTGTAGDTLSITPITDLVMHTTLGNDVLSFRQGEQAASYQLTVYNQGHLASAGAVTVTGTLPAGLTYNSISASGWTCSFADPAVTCTRSDSLPGGAPPNEPGTYSAYPEIFLYVNVAPNAPASVTFNPAVSGGGEPTSPTPTGNGANNSSKATPITPVADLTVAAVAGGTLKQSGEVSYAITARNSGAGATYGPVTLTATLGPGLTATRMTGPGWNCDLATTSCVRTTPVAAGAAFDDVTLKAAVSRHAPSSSTTAFAVGGGGELNASDDAVSVPAAIAASPDLESTLTASGPFAQGDNGLDTLVLTASNVGYAPTAGTRTATVSLPRGFTATAVSGTGWTCTVGTVSCVRSDALAPGASDPPVTVTLRIAADAPGDVRFSGAVSGGGQLYEDNDTAFALKYVAQKPDLRVAISHEGTFHAGGTGRYTVVVSNTGYQPTDGSEVKVTLTVPAGLTAVALGGTGWTCATSTLTCTRSDVLAAGGDYPPIALFVDIAAGAPASVTTSAAVSGGGEVATGNDTASDATPIAPAAAAAAVDNVAPVSSVSLASEKVAAPLLAARGSLGFSLTCAKRCTVSAKLVLSRASARALHLRSRTVRTLARTVTTSKAQRLSLALPARVRAAARRHHVKTVSVTLTITARYADGRRTTTARTVRVRV